MGLILRNMSYLANCLRPHQAYASYAAMLQRETVERQASTTEEYGHRGLDKACRQPLVDMVPGGGSTFSFTSCLAWPCLPLQAAAAELDSIMARAETEMQAVGQQLAAAAAAAAKGHHHQ
jgi:hypothetical protein